MEKQHGSRKMFTPRVGRHCTFVVIEWEGRGERFCGKHPKYKRTFFARGTSRNNKTDADALCFETTKYTEGKMNA